MSDLFQLRRGTLAEWTASTDIPYSGEPIVITDLAEIRVGNGADPAEELPTAGSISSFDRVQYTVTVSSLNVSDGFLVLPFAVKYPDKVVVTVSGLEQRNAAGLNAPTPSDFVVLNDVELHIRGTHAPYPSLSTDIEAGDSITITYDRVPE